MFMLLKVMCLFDIISDVFDNYMQGALMGSWMVTWATIMFAWNARPPNPIMLAHNLQSRGDGRNLKEGAERNKG